MFSTALSLLRTPQKALPRPSDANTTRGGKRNAPSSPDGSDGTIDIEENENKIAEKVAVLEGRVSSLSDRVEYQQDRILQLEQTVEQQKVISKSTNIIIYGIEEHLRDGEVRQLFGGGRDLPSLIPNIVDTYRLGQLKANAARPRPVLVKFNSTRSRNAAFKHSKRLRGRSLSLAEDLTPSQQEARRRLLPNFHTFKAQGYPVLWRGGTLCFRQADGRVSQWVPGAPPPGPPPARASQEPRVAPTPPTSSQPQGPAPPMRDYSNEIQPAHLDPQPNAWMTIVNGRPVPRTVLESRRASAMSRGNATSTASHSTSQNAPRARTAAAPAGGTRGARPQQVPGGRPVAAHAGRAPGIQATMPYTASAVQQEDAATAEGMDWMPPQPRTTTRHVPGATDGKRIAIERNLELEEPTTTSTLEGGDLGPKPSNPQ
jgi:hypothetical protein